MTSGALSSSNLLPAEQSHIRAPWGLPVALSLLLLGCLYALYFCASTPDISGHAVGSDDAFISYRYSQNLVNGHGLVFNPGELVEGYTNLLYVLLMTIPVFLHLDMYTFSAAFNTACMAGAAAVFWSYLRAQKGEMPAALGAILFALSPSIWVWASSGLETAVVVLLQVAIWVLVETVARRSGRLSVGLLGLAMALLVMVRADGFITGFIAIGYLAVVKRRIKLAGGLAVLLAATLGSVIAWRLSYYGEIWPNTYYAKVSSTLLLRLASSTRQFIGISARQGLLVYLLVIAGFATTALLRCWKERSFERLRFDHVFPVAWVAYWLYVGGDVFEDRFLIILIPYGIFQLLELLVDAPRPLFKLIVAATVLIPLLVLVRDPQYGKALSGGKYDRWIALGKFLAPNYRGQVLATSAAGKIPFYSGMLTIDVLGLNDRHIAHLDRTDLAKFAVGHGKFDPDYVLAKKPRLISGWVFGSALDIDSGMVAAKYRPAGYGMRFLVNSKPFSTGQYDVLEVRGCSDTQIALLAQRGWNWGVVERDSPPAAAPCPDVPGAL